MLLKSPGWFVLDSGDPHLLGKESVAKCVLTPLAGFPPAFSGCREGQVWGHGWLFVLPLVSAGCPWSLCGIKLWWVLALRFFRA